MPSLKEINATTNPPVALQSSPNADNNNTNPIISSSDNSNDAPEVPNNNKNSTVKKDDGLPSTIAKHTNGPPTPQPPSPPQIQHESPTQVPTDETSFTHPPHFSSTNPFHRHLSTLDLSMRCTICYEVLNVPVSLVPCLHNFCSLCIRSHLRTTYTGMKRRADCPICHEKVGLPGSSDYQNGILANKSLEQQVDNYKKVRNEIRSSLVQLDVLKQEKKLGCIVPSLSSMAARLDDNDDDDGKQKRKREKKEEGATTRKSKRTRKTVAAAAAAAMNDSSSSNEESDDEYDDDDNNHDDAYNHNSMSSTNQSTATKKPPPPPPPRPTKKSQQQKLLIKRKPTVSYHNLNKKKLVELCTKEGLHATGKEDELKQRHSDFITLYNSECDSDHPRSVNELIRELKQREKFIKIEANRADPKRQSKFMKSIGNSISAFNEGNIERVSSGNTDFDTTLHNNFAKLIADARKKKEQEKSSAESDGKQAVMSTGDTVNGTASALSNHDEEDGKMPACIMTAVSQQQSMAASEAGRNSNSNNNNSNSAASPSASIDSDKTVETPQQTRQKKKNSQKQPSSASSKAAAAAKAPSASAAKKKRTSSKTSKKKSNTKPTTKSSSASASSRIDVLGPWVCKKCTFENVNNVERVTVCEMCMNKRPKEEVVADCKLPARKEIEVVNIDC